MKYPVVDTNNQDLAWWSIYIDIEGFSSLFLKEPTQGRDLLISLVNDLCHVATGLSKNQRLGIYQLGGDGFLIKCNSVSQDFETVIEISVALLRLAFSTIRLRKVHISYGDFADISGLYKGIESSYSAQISANGVITVGGNIMTLVPLIGTALIRAYNLKSPSGPLLFVDNHYTKHIKELGLNTILPLNEKGLVSDTGIAINWINTGNKSIEKRVNEFLKVTDTKQIYSQFQAHLAQNSAKICNSWLGNARLLAQDL